MRLNKFLAEAGVASRRGADKIIKNGRVSVNGKIAILGDKVSGKEKILIDGEKIKLKEEKEYIALYKPVGIVSTAYDERGRQKVLDLVKSEKRLYPVGRLDLLSEGLMLLTNDGDLSLKLTHPKYHLEKEYEVTLDRELNNKKIKTGINKINKREKNKINIIMYEGKKRQIREM
ncbi:MAG: pseudouridine synthase, partial [Candidatus Shapirobacteria bacterium]|nr:pseudouridine synthase [Candidatus Shapirobacteria bacterium]